ncbi:hypothetical protein OHW85_23450, partial [Acinetobacter baumannii]|nr:hypothetical protein [Acinetobacter baumannii]
IDFGHKLETFDPELQRNLKILSSKITSGEIYLDAYSTQNIFLGKETLKTYQAKSKRNQSPLKIFTITEMMGDQPVYQKGYIQSMIGIDRHSDTLAPFVTFTATTNPTAESQKIQDLKFSENEKNLKQVFNIKEDFTKNPLPNDVTSAHKNSRQAINQSRAMHQEQDVGSFIDFNNI